jgi:hypothetical protein
VIIGTPFLNLLSSGCSNKSIYIETIKDHLWIWGHVEGSHNGEYNLPSGHKGSTITMMDACNYMGIKNCMVVGINGQPASGTEEKFAKQLSSCENVGWSVVPAGGPNDIISDHIESVGVVLNLSSKYSNIRNAMFDDYFVGDYPRCSTKQLAEIRVLLHKETNPLDMWVVVYDYNLEKYLVEEQLKYFDVINFWTWEANNLTLLEPNIKKLRSRIPGKRIVLGCYMYDYGTSKPMPIEKMAEQCNLGLKYLNEGLIEGMVFLATCITDLNLDAVEWTREWIAKVGQYNIHEINLKEIYNWSKSTIQKYV